MPSEALKSSAITNLDALPMVVNSAGVGGVARGRLIDGRITVTDGKTSGSTYQLVRIRTNSIVKHLQFKCDVAVTTLTADIGFYYSTSTNSDGTLPANLGLKVGTGQEFGAAKDLKAATFSDLCNNVTAAGLDKEAWDLAGLATDPGGFFDIVLTTTATNSGAAVIYAEATIVDG